MNPNSSGDRKRLLQSFFDLPPQDKTMFYRALERLRWLLILWELEEFDPASMPSVTEKRHILLAYKFLHILWFDKLAERPDQPFTLHVRDRIPEDQSPETINKAFDTGTEELADLCKDMPSPSWLKNATAMRTSLESFPTSSR